VGERAYQTRMVEDVRAAWARGVEAVLLQLPTGGGKTHTAASIIAAEPGPVVFAAHLDSLVGDTAARLRRAGVRCGIVAPWAPAEPEHAVQVASLATLHARRLAPPAELVIVDECHRSAARSISSWLRRYVGKRWLGLTATPQRGDGAPLGDLFDVMVQGPTVAELMAAGHLCPYTLLCPPSARGDGVAELHRHGARWARALYFAETLAAGADHAARLRALGYTVEEIYGDTPRDQREAVRARFRAGAAQALVGVGVFIEGFDEPAADAVVLDAPFGTVGRYLQAVGRGLRPAPEKTGLLILDVRGAVHTHGLPDEGRVWSLSGEASTRTEPGMRIATCPACFAVFRAGPKACPRCGGQVTEAHEYQRTPTREERLVEYAKLDVGTRRQKYYHAMMRLALSRFHMSVPSAEKYATKKALEKFP
jgi:DNA repair protein RadD